jgi:rhodanese-related sulfurtransferase
MPITKGCKALVDEARTQIDNVPVTDAIGLHGRDDVVFVDLRDPRELERDGMIPGAFHAPRGMLEFWVDPASPYYKEIFGSGKRFVLYCASGWRSALATATLVQMGLEPVGHVDGGFGAWKKAGGPVGDKPAKDAA